MGTGDMSDKIFLHSDFLTYVRLVIMFDDNKQWHDIDEEMTTI